MGIFSPKAVSAAAVEKPHSPDSDREASPPNYSTANNADTTEVDPMAGKHEGGVNYKSMTWWQGGLLMIAETISLGILSLPVIFSSLGLIVGVLVLVIFGSFATYSGYVIAQYKWKYPGIHTMADAGQLIGGRFLKEFIGVGQMLFYIFVMGAHILTFGLALGVLTDGKVCNLVWTALCLLISFLFTIPRTLGNLSYYCIASFASIFITVLFTVVGLGTSKPGYTPGVGYDFQLLPPKSATIQDIITAICIVCFAYAGHVAFFTFISELKDPRQFPKSLALLQVSDMTMYIVSASLIYVFSGSYTTSPAMSILPNISMIKAGWGLAIPTIVIAGVVNGHVAIKYVYVRLLKNNQDDLMHQKSFKSWAIWIGIGLVSWVLSWIIAEGIPVFDILLGLTGAIFATWFTFGLSGMFWLHMNVKWVRGPTWRGRGGVSKWCLAVVNVTMIVMAAFLCFGGLWAIGIQANKFNETKKPFSC